MFVDGYGEGQCISCGLLGQRPRDPSQPLCSEVMPAQRAEGHIGDTPHTEMFMPWCFVGRANLAREIRELGNDVPLATRTFQTITRHRDCKGWYPYTEFLSPKEHYEELNMRQLEESRRQFEERMEENRREWQKWMTEQAVRDQERSDKLMLRWTIFGIIVAVILAIMQLVGAFWAQALFHN